MVSTLAGAVFVHARDFSPIQASGGIGNDRSRPDAVLQRARRVRARNAPSLRSVQLLSPGVLKELGREREADLVMLRAAETTSMICLYTAFATN